MPLGTGWTCHKSFETLKMQTSSYPLSGGGCKSRWPRGGTFTEARRQGQANCLCQLRSEAHGAQHAELQLNEVGVPGAQVDSKMSW